MTIAGQHEIHGIFSIRKSDENYGFSADTLPMSNSVLLRNKMCALCPLPNIIGS